jgi:hypothetical protein
MESMKQPLQRIVLFVETGEHIGFSVSSIVEIRQLLDFPEKVKPDTTCIRDILHAGLVLADY